MGYRAISALRDAAWRLAARLRRADPARTEYELGQRHNAEAITAALRNIDAAYEARLDAISERSRPGSPPFDFPEFRDLWPLHEAIDNAADHAAEYNGAPEYRRLRQLWPQATSVLTDQRQAFVRYGNELIDEVDAQGVLRTGAMRTARTVADVAGAMAARLARKGRTGSAGHQAMVAVRNAADRSALTMRRTAQPSPASPSRADTLARIETAYAALTADLDAHAAAHGPDKFASALQLGEPQQPVLAGSRNAVSAADQARTSAATAQRDSVEL
jgi:hypothetical protein